MKLQTSGNNFELAIEAVVQLLHYRRDLAIYEAEQMLKRALADFRQAHAECHCQIHAQATHYLHLVKIKIKVINSQKKKQPVERHFLFDDVLSSLENIANELREQRKVT